MLSILQWCIFRSFYSTASRLRISTILCRPLWPGIEPLRLDDCVVIGPGATIQKYNYTLLLAVLFIATYSTSLLPSVWIIPRAHVLSLLKPGVFENLHVFLQKRRTDNGEASESKLKIFFTDL